MSAGALQACGDDADMGRVHDAIARLRRRHHASDEGFTLIELAVASGIMLFILTAMAYATTVGFVDIGYSRQRQSATGLANETLEIVRALPKADLERGLDGTDLASSADPNITTAGTSPETYYFRGEEIPYGPNAPVAPLVPHQQQQLVGNSRFDISLYLTRFKDEAGVEQKGVLRVTVIVTWNAVRKGTTPEVEAQSLIYFPVGCQSPSTHPFAAPCEAAFYASATTGPADTRIEGTLSGVALRDADWSLGQESSDLQTEQVMTVQGFARTPGGAIRFTDGSADEIAGLLQATTSSSNNPTESRPPYDSVTRSQTAGEKSKVSAAGNGLRMVAGAATATSVSTISANATQPCPHSSSQTDNLPCGWGSGSQSSSLGVQLVLSGRDPAALLAATSATSSVVTNKDVCSSDGCVGAAAQRALPQIRIAGLPGSVANPPGWDPAYGLVTLLNYSATATAQSGYGTSAPSVTVGSFGVIRYYNGSGYTDMPFPTGGASTTIPVPASITAGDTTITATLATGGHSTLSEAGCAGACRTRGEARVASPILGTITYRVGTIADLTINIDLGTIAARTAYAPSPAI